MNAIVEYELDQRGLSWLRAQLLHGQYLSHALVNTLELAEGLVTTGLPMGLGDDALYDFDGGWRQHLGQPIESVNKQPSGAKMAGVNSPLQWIASTVNRFLDHEDGTCIIEDGLAKRSDPSLDSYLGTLRLYNDEVYHQFTEKMSVHQAERAILDSSSILPPQVGVLFVGSEGKLQPPMSVLTSGELREAAAEARHIFIPSYDDEGYLLWSRVEPKC